MGKGRKAQTNAVKALKGTQPVRMNQGEVESEVISKLPNAPRYFSDTAKSVYKTLGRHLAGSRVLSIPDMEMFISFSYEYGEYIDSIKEQQLLEKQFNEELNNEPAEPDGDDKNEFSVFKMKYKAWEKRVNLLMYKKNAADKKNSRSWERAMKLASEFGITPAARAKAQAVASGKEESDPLDNL